MSNQSGRTLSRLPLLTGALSVLLLAAACGGSSSAGSVTTTGGGAAAASTINAATTTAGKVLVDSKGRTMYAFAADTKGHSACSGSCATYWPPVPAGAKPPTAGAGVTATFGVIKRQDGTPQLTADGWPMYTYAGDSKAGAATGQGKNLSGGLWWVVDPSGKWITKTGSAGKASSSPAGRYGY
jgi:predicted lipoprotein with Yx(FWY)xxD motif